MLDKSSVMEKINDKNVEVIKVEDVSKRERLALAMLSAGMDSVSKVQLNIAEYLIDHSTDGKYYVGTYRDLVNETGCAFDTAKHCISIVFVKYGLIEEEKKPELGSPFGMWKIGEAFQKSQKCMMNITYKKKGEEK